MDGLEHRNSLGIEVGRRSKTNAARNCSAKIGENVAEEVVSDDHVVLTRALNHVDASCIDMVVCGSYIGVLEGDRVEGALPQIARERQHVGLVHKGQVFAWSRLC